VLCVLRRSVAVESTAKEGDEKTDASERDVQNDELRSRSKRRALHRWPLKSILGNCPESIVKGSVEIRSTHKDNKRVYMRLCDKDKRQQR